MFDSTINIYQVDDYDRKIEKTWTRLTQLEKVKTSDWKLGVSLI